REHVVADAEARCAARAVERGGGDQAPELAALVVAQEGGDLHDVAGDGADRQLAVLHAVAYDRARQRAGDCLAEFIERFIHDAKSITARSFRCGESSSAAPPPPRP